MPADKAIIVRSLYIFLRVLLKRAFACLGTKIIGFAFIDERCRCAFLVHIHSTYGIFGHCDYLLIMILHWQFFHSFIKRILSYAHPRQLILKKQDEPAE